ncbi:putative enoyl-CoA hydratase/isomerase YngF [Octopus bimaculoides]|uniref:Enoyl-CoA hydratase n=1 Tax=Octopus bimaculoides TaxID=37653 RepID=A0A0L8GZN0_OCTBM|nr:putative enoyl-CoA hydratase/isomerase YngF [Octopus bimaculoides]|eukprot:XP_014776733.1 PREDICTED: putative enoyl-CoA hydratase/isomerase YngF [Octopus bimaculoides]
MTLPFGQLGLRCLSRSVQCGRNVKTVFLQQTTSAGRFVHNIAKKDSVTVELIGKICLIGINCPEKKNAVDSQTAHGLYRAFQDFENNDQTRVAVLFGKGGNFCAGFDLKELADEFRTAEVSLPDSPSRTERAPMGPTRMSFSKPVIAAVSGYAVAGGLELALMCDLRVVEESAIMGVYNRRLGVPLVDGCTVRLPKLIGLSRAMDLILTGRPVDSKEALQIGLANRVVPNGTAIGQATQLALSISRYPQMCLQTDRRSTYYSCYDATSRQEALQYEFLNGRDVLTVESIKGAQKFVEGYGKHGAFDPENKDK